MVRLHPDKAHVTFDWFDRRPRSPWSRSPLFVMPPLDDLTRFSISEIGQLLGCNLVCFLIGVFGALGSVFQITLDGQSDAFGGTCGARSRRVRPTRSFGIPSVKSIGTSLRSSRVPTGVDGSSNQLVRSDLFQWALVV